MRVWVRVRVRVTGVGCDGILMEFSGELTGGSWGTASSLASYLAFI